MEGFIAKWYAKITKNSEDYKLVAKRVTEYIVEGSCVLEVAPGPGYLAIELAKLGYKVTGLDISKSFVEIAQAKAKEAGVEIEFRQGDAAHMPFNDETFDFIVCRAAFKNFTEPIGALNEMYRVLRFNGKASINDLRRDASQEGIEDEVKKMNLNRINSLITKWIFKHMLIKRAYSKVQIKEFVSKTNFRKCNIKEEPIGLDILLEK